MVSGREFQSPRGWIAIEKVTPVFVAGACLGMAWRLHLSADFDGSTALTARSSSGDAPYGRFISSPLHLHAFGGGPGTWRKYLSREQIFRQGLS